MTGIEDRVAKVEEGQATLTQSLRDFSKDFHQLSATLIEVKDVLKQMSKTETEFALFRQEFRSHAKEEEDTFKRIHSRIDEVVEDVDSGITPSLLKLVLGVAASILISFLSWLTLTVNSMDKRSAEADVRHDQVLDSMRKDVDACTDTSHKNEIEITKINTKVKR